MLYDLEFRFEQKQDRSGHKLTVLAGNRGFELNSSLEESKLTRFARIVYFIVKSEEEEFSFVLEKNGRTVGRCVVFTEELLSFHPNQLKRKLTDPNGSSVASLRFKCEKAKNLSLPHNNPFWKDTASKGKQGGVCF